MKYFFSTILFFNVFLVNGQSISPKTLNIGGSTGSSNSVILDYSIGESSSIAYFNTSNNSTLSSGLLQSFSPVVMGISDLSFIEGKNISLFPNPAKQKIRIKGNLNLPGFIEFQVVNESGMILSLEPKTYYSNFFEKEFNIKSYNDGVYFIRLNYQASDNSLKSAVFKFIKIQ